MTNVLLTRRYQVLEHEGEYPVFWSHGQWWSNAELLKQGARISMSLAAEYVGSDFHLVSLVEGAELILMYLVAEHLDMPFVPLDPQLSMNEVLTSLAYCQPCIVVGTKQWSDELSHCTANLFSIRYSNDGKNQCSVERVPCKQIPGVNTLSQISIQDPYPDLIVFTSGTTKNAKGVSLCAASIVSNTEQIIHALGYQPRDRMMTSLPLTHIYGLCLVNIAWLAGASLMAQHLFRPKSVVGAIEALQVTSFDGIPRMYCDLLRQASRDPKGFRSATATIRMWNCGGSNLSQQVSQTFAEFAAQPILNSYGLTEAPWVSYSTRSYHKWSSVGRIVPGVSVIIEGAGNTSGTNGAVGEICISGDLLMQGYYRDMASTMARIRDGWLHSGDLGFFDNDGYLYLQGRLDEQISVSGHKVALAEIEQVIVSCPGVAEAAVISNSHPIRENDIYAFVVPYESQTITSNILQRYCRERLADYKTPRHYIFVDNLQYTSLGKVNKRVLRLVLSETEA